MIMPYQYISFLAPAPENALQNVLTTCSIAQPLVSLTTVPFPSSYFLLGPPGAATSDLPETANLPTLPLNLTFHLLVPSATPYPAVI